jgi:hypothetical protein
MNVLKWKRKDGTRASRLMSRAGCAAPARKRGVVAVVAMLFLIMFGSLAAAMAITAKGNIKTASTHVHVMRVLGAAETGMAVAEARLREAAGRFIVGSSTLDAYRGTAAWQGNIGAFGSATIAPPVGFTESQLPFGIAEALANRHAADLNVVSSLGFEQPVIGNALSGLQDADEYATSHWVFTPAVSVESGTTTPLCFQIVYAPLANGLDVRVIVTGYDLSYTRNGTALSRTIMQDFRINKRVNQAVSSPSKVMIGKNVLVNGDLGAGFTGTQYTNGDPLIMRSDFLGLNTVLDQKLTTFFTALGTYDVDKDNRLRFGHATERQGIPSGQTDYDGNGTPDGAFDDVTRDGYLDEFDIFLKHYDANGDRKVALSDALRAGTPAENLSAEFVGGGGVPVDEDLALLIDSANPDRNKNKVWGFVDVNNNGRWDNGEAFSDLDASQSAPMGNRDQVLGYRDGVLDYRDQYRKVGGRVMFRSTAASWQAGQGANYLARLRGSIVPGRSRSPMAFGVSTSQMPQLTAANFEPARAVMGTLADGESFNAQVASQLGVSEGALAGYVENRPEGSTQPRYLRVDPDANLDGRPDNFATAYFEKAPFNSPSFSDWYYRPVYENMTFRNVQIPIGSNALFKNCSFIGVTLVRTHAANTHVLWSEYGKMQLGSDGRPEPAVPRNIYGDNGAETSYPTMLPPTAIPPQQMILMANNPLDKADLTAAQALVTQGYNLLPDPLVVNGRRITDTKALSNNVRFHDCLFVGSVVSDNPQHYIHARNKLQFTGGTRFSTRHPERPDDPALNPDSADMGQIVRSSMMLPGYSVDVGSFNSPPTQNVRLQGAIVAGVLDARGNTRIDGALMLTFAPTLGVAPLRDSMGNAVGNPAAFNTSLGYFGPSDGDAESMDPTTLPVVNGVKIVGYDVNGDGLADFGPSSPPDPVQYPNAVAVPFHGYGKITIEFDPTMALPDGLPLPLQYAVVANSYREGKP